MTVDNSILAGNETLEGGGIFNSGDGTVTVSRSTLASNSASWSGGGIYNYGTIFVTNSTLSGNSTNHYGGGITNFSVITITNSSLSDNSAGEMGGGIIGEFNAANTILANNSAFYNGPDCWGTLISQDYNLVENTDGCDITGNIVHNIIGLDPELGPLQDNGGRTPTHMPLPGSPATDAGDPLNCPPTDQRGIPRPQDGTGDGQAISEIGSVEYLLDAVPLSGVNVTGPAVGDVDTVYAFTATVTPISATQPIIYVWQVAGQATVTQTSGITDTAAFASSLPGACALAVTANNGSSSVTNTHTIMLNDRPIAGLLASNSSPANPHEIVTLTAIITSGTNVSYAWEFGDGSSANGQVATHVYAQPGIFTTTVTAINSVSTVSATSVVTILESQYIVYLPFVSIR